MAASANPSAVHRNGSSNNNNNNNNNGNSSGGAPENTSGSAVSLAGPTQTTLRHNPGLSLDWTPDEQSMLEDLLTKYASEPNIIRYAKIAQALKDKTVRDVALRCRWMNKKENGKRRKDDHNSRKSKDKKEKAIESLPKSSQVANRLNGPPYVQPMMVESDDGISYRAIGGATGQLLEQSANALDQISANFSAFKIHENVELFCQARTNILSILNDFNDLPEIMKQMPPLPVKLNEDLANSILPRKAMANTS
ncbi:histone H2A deubiquitinase [Perilla frutescens var. hirtella]|uniref:Histone H2A deubiquitinase n=1 Tax=Perilla frutescens var. hirtella TaxID=608512 RepID=A0AAD4J6W6_PERFH|nr:histone H2A deubiquitinase [Perilla frutescens var. hirtella]